MSNPEQAKDSFFATVAWMWLVTITLLAGPLVVSAAVTAVVEATLQAGQPLASDSVARVTSGLHR